MHKSHYGCICYAGIGWEWDESKSHVEDENQNPRESGMWFPKRVPILN